jgi:hypothetical protein
MKKVDSKKFITKSKVISDIRKIKNKFCKEFEKHLNKYGALTEEISYETKINSLKKENERLKRELLELRQQVLIKNENVFEYHDEFVDKPISDADTNVEYLELTPQESKRLAQMGNSWFVSYMYHLCNHPEHTNWKKTLNGFREGYFKSTRAAHKKYLNKIAQSNEASLGTNRIGLSGAEIRRMAQELLDNWDKASKNLTYIKIF